MRTSPLRLFLLPAMLLVLLADPAYADPVTITFNEAEPSTQNVYPTYTEQGFNFCCSLRFGSYSGNKHLEVNSQHVTAGRIVTIDFRGGTFDFLGAELHFSYGRDEFRASNGATFVLGATRVVDPQGLFTGITWLQWVHYGCIGEPGPCPAAIDNLRFNTYPGTVPAPEPATLLLLGSGLLGALKVARRKREV